MQELAPERRAVREAIESLRLTPVMFELGARPYPPRALYRAYLEQSDIFIGLYWESYGWVAPGEELSGLEDEYRLSGDRPKLIYIRSPAANRQPRLADMIARIQSDDVSYRPFGTADELRALVADDLAVLLTERFEVSAKAPAEPPRPAPIPPLPRPVTRLIGRDQDLTRVLDLLEEPGVRMVTIVGPGGIGKSRLALAVADGARERYPDGIVHIDLAPLTEPSLVLPTIAKSLGIEEHPGASVAERLRDRLAAARMLIVLDNMEQLANAANDLSDLLEATGAVRLLVTSRRILDIRGERVYTLGPLAVPTNGAVTAAVELFLERARSTELVDQSLLQALGEAAEPWFGMLETIREYAVEQLEASGTADDFRAGHQAHYLELAERGNAALSTAEQVECLERLGRENDNFRAVLRRALRRGDATSALRMGRALATYWYMSGSGDEGRGWMEQVAGLRSVQPDERSVGWTIAAIEAFLQGDFEPIETGLDDALRDIGEGKDRRIVAFAQLLQAIARGVGSNEQQWQDVVTEASRRLEAAGEPLAIGFGLVAGAVLARLHGRTDEARRLAQRARGASQSRSRNPLDRYLNR